MTPSLTPYPLSDVRGAVEAVVGGPAWVQCNHDKGGLQTLFQVGLCLDKHTLQPLPCDARMLSKVGPPSLELQCASWGCVRSWRVNWVHPTGPAPLKGHTPSETWALPGSYESARERTKVARGVVYATELHRGRRHVPPATQCRCPSTVHPRQQRGHTVKPPPFHQA